MPSSAIERTGNAIEREPTLTVGFATAAVTALLGLFAAFGFDLTEEQRNAILACIPVVVAIIGLASVYLRGKVASPAFVEKTQAAFWDAGRIASDKGAPVFAGEQVVWDRNVPGDLQWPNE